MRLRVAAGWAVTVLLAAVGCGQTSDTGATSVGASGANVDEPPAMGLDFAQSGSQLLAVAFAY